ncbi:gluconate 2-dehydrogenase subunit 3 family protein [Spirosoma taeanense]|uniref:Gluconate 2-dehydrogenase subunit 3 family protein n=1 Tax=Spirosoma taeanense TaxID=2735870 RepID=A0A6M5YG89_9BACT|nr:gluconate 2-dehydrogenase subunit 3 family protein [Spirosoma taeanense]QJW92253.1 gluconate 2-dehydrogenase subunit 3 family protein [Spirosoma taeanense]
MAGAVGGLISLPAWASGWTSETVRPLNPFLSRSQDELLADLAETIIPATDTPGAKALNVHQFIQKVVADCYDKPSAETFRKGLAAVDELAQKSFGKPFSQGDTTQRIGVLNQLAQSTDADQKNFYSMVKGLTIRGYMSSEYVMTNLTHYEMIPGRYHGCVPVPAKPISQTK